MDLTFKNITNKIARLYSCYEPRVWVEPIAVAMIAALKKENPQIDTPNDYTKHMIEAKRSSGKNHTAVRQIQTRADVEKARDHLSSTIIKSIEASAHELADYKQYLNHMFSELLNNVTDHASSCIPMHKMTIKEKRWEVRCKGRCSDSLRNDNGQFF